MTTCAIGGHHTTTEDVISEVFYRVDTGMKECCQHFLANLGPSEIITLGVAAAGHEPSNPIFLRSLYEGEEKGLLRGRLPHCSRRGRGRLSLLRHHGVELHHQRALGAKRGRGFNHEPVRVTFLLPPAQRLTACGMGTPFPNSTTSLNPTLLCQ